MPVDIVSEDESIYKNALSLYAQGEFETALEGFQDVLNRFEWSDRRERSRYYMGKCLMGMAELYTEDGDTVMYTTADSLYIEAIETFRMVRFNSDRHVESQVGIGCCYYYRGLVTNDSALYDSAQSVLLNVTESWPHHSSADNAVFYLGLRNRSLGDTTEAIAMWQSLIEMYSDESSYDNALFEIGYTYYKQDEYDSSSLYHKRLITELPNSSKADNAALYIGHQHYKRYELAVAGREYQEAQEQLDSSLNWYYVIVNDYSEGGAYDNALFEIGDYYYLKRFLNENSDSVVTYFTAYCDIADTSTSKYDEAVQKLMAMGVIYEK